MSYFDGVTASEHGDALREFSRRLNRQATELVEAQEFAVMATELTGVSARESLWIACYSILSLSGPLPPTAACALSVARTWPLCCGVLSTIVAQPWVGGVCAAGAGRRHIRRRRRQLGMPRESSAGAPVFDKHSIPPANASCFV